MNVNKVSAALVLIALAGCGDGESTRPLQAPVPVSGVLEMVGGPPGAGPDPARGRVTFDGNGATWEVPTKADGTFSLELNPGTYDVTGTSPLYQSGKAQCHADGKVRVSSAMGPVKVICQRK